MNNLRYGYTLSDLQRVARSAAATTRAMAGDYDDRYAEAFSGAAEALYAAEHWIPEHKLWNAARDALFEMSRKDRSYHGCAFKHSEGWQESGTGPRYVTYWTEINRSTPSPENGIIERLALEQILPTLTDRQREVVGALAAFDDHEQARQALGMGKVYVNHLSNARTRFLTLWHEGEAPSRPWGTDRRGNTRLGVVLKRRKKKAGKVDGRTARAGEQTHCANGHLFDEANTRFDADGWRVCRQCKRDRAAARRQAASKTQLPRTEFRCGHPMDDENTYVERSTGYTRCRRCIAARSARTVSA
jgi:hypothetical protein